MVVYQIWGLQIELFWSVPTIVPYSLWRNFFPTEALEILYVINAYEPLELLLCSRRGIKKEIFHIKALKNKKNSMT